jgi:hypothetical protein
MLLQFTSGMGWFALGLKSTYVGRLSLEIFEENRRGSGLRLAASLSKATG